jgi:predicted nucleic acid-binding protein
LGDAYVLDSSVLVDLARGDPRPFAALEALPEEAALWSVTVVRTEVIAGTRPEDGPSVRQVLDQMRWLPVDEDLADLAGRMAAHYGPAHQGIGLADYLVAAATRLLGARLLTLNVRHFPMLEGLERAYSWAPDGHAT